MNKRDRFGLGAQEPLPSRRVCIKDEIIARRLATKALAACKIASPSSSTIDDILRARATLTVICTVDTAQALTITRRQSMAAQTDLSSNGACQCVRLKKARRIFLRPLENIFPLIPVLGSSYSLAFREGSANKTKRVCRVKGTPLKVAVNQVPYCSKGKKEKKEKMGKAVCAATRGRGAR